MNKKVKIVIIIVTIIIFVGIGILYYNKNSKEEIEYIPQEEISETQLRQTIISLYFIDKNTKELVPEGRLIDVKLLLEEPYQTLMQLLIDGPKNDKLEESIPEGTRINKIEIKNDILYIDLSKEFIENHIGGEKNESKTIYSIVNTMTTLTEVNGVRILIEGEENREFKDKKINFKETFINLDGE